MTTSTTLDLFAPAPAPATADPGYERMLEALLSDAGRRNAWKAMTAELRAELAVAVGTVARAKRAAYDDARAGRKRSNVGWIAGDAALAAAIARLNAASVDCDSIPMAGA